MPARTKKRAKFTFRGRPFIWWVDADRCLRIASVDKRFVIAYPLVIPSDAKPAVEVIGSEFPGLDESHPRPCWFEVPTLSSDSMGGWVDELLRWSFDPTRVMHEVKEPPRFL